MHLSVSLRAHGPYHHVTRSRDKMKKLTQNLCFSESVHSTEQHGIKFIMI